jgi:hypothetical protein
MCATPKPRAANTGLRKLRFKQFLTSNKARISGQATLVDDRPRARAPLRDAEGES